MSNQKSFYYFYSNQVYNVLYSTAGKHVVSAKNSLQSKALIWYMDSWETPVSHTQVV